MLRYLTIAMIILLHANIYSQSDPNNDPNWDWRASSTFTVYPQALGSIQVNTTSPFLQGGISEAVFDNRPEDGWVLVMRDFGTTSRGASVPYFTLYNKYQGLLRVFPYVVMNGAYTKGFINIYWGTTIKTAALTFLNNTAWGVNTLDSTKNNSSAAFAPVVNANWAFADFPMAYEYNVSSFTNPNFHFEIWGSTTSNVNLTIQGDILQHFGNNQAANLPNPGFFQEGGTFQLAQKHVQGTQSTWAGWKSVIDNIGKAIDSNTTSSALLNLRNSIKSLSTSWTISNLSGIGVAVGLLDFFITGGRLTKKEQPAPMNFKANFTATGTISTDVRVAGAITLPLPGSNITNTVTATNLLYNNPLGILNLRETPIVEHRRYDQPVGTNITRETHSFRVKNDLVIDLNPNSDLEIQDVKAALVYVPKTQPIAQEFLGYADQGHSNIDNTPIELESATAGAFEFRTPYVNAYSVKYQKITIPLESLNFGFNVQGGEWIPFNLPLNTALGKLYLKIHATLRLKNSSTDRQPVVFVAKYNVLNQEGDAVNGPWSTPPLPFTVNITRKFEFLPDETLPPAYGYTGVENIVVNTPPLIGNAIFSLWSDGNNDLTRTFSSNTNIQALYKLPHKSNSTTAYSNPSQRRFIQTPDGVKHICYESMGKVWYELSTDNGATWILGNGGKPLSSTDAKNPSMSFYGNQIGIVWQEKSGSSFKIKMALFWMSDYSSSLFSTIAEDDNNYSHNASPVVEWGYNGNIVVVWSGNDLCANPFGGTALKYWYGSATSNGISLIGQCGIYGTDGNSINPTITADYTASSNPFYFHFAWQQYVNVSTSKIYYSKLYYNQNSLVSTTFEEASLNSGYSNNLTPVIVIRKTGSLEYIYVTWLGNRTSPTSETRVLLKYKLGSSWSVTGVYGTSPVQNFSINKGTTLISNQEPLALCWSEPNGSSFYNKVMKSPGSGIKTLITTGKDIRINNGTDFSSMFVNSFSSVSQPYSFSFSQNLGSLGKVNSIFNGREGIVGKNGAQFFFALGDITLDGQNINFVSIPDSVSIASLSLLNTYFESEPFTVSSLSNLTYGVQYGITDSVLCSSVLNSGQYISFKVELLDAVTNNVLDVFDEVSYTGNNVYQYNNLGYKVNLSGIGEKSVKLRLVTDTNSEFGFGFSNRIADQSMLVKVGFKTINYKGDAVVKEYALEQNYPNPFNPGTTIRYQLPKDGLVTLKIYDILGSEIATLVNEEKIAGKYEVNFDASNLASGVYVYRIAIHSGKLQAGEFVNSKKMILLK